MIAISDRSRHAVSALTELASRGDCGPVPIMEIAEARAIPLHVLEQLFASLRRGGLLQSQRGVKGGYSFRLPPSQVDLLQIVETVDGRVAPQAGDLQGAELIWVEARRALAEVLESTTIAELVAREEAARAAPMFHI